MLQSAASATLHIPAFRITDEDEGPADEQDKLLDTEPSAAKPAMLKPAKAALRIAAAGGGHSGAQCHHEH